MIEEVLRFWFEEATPAQWWKKDAAFDAAIARRFAVLHAAAARCECHAWRATPQGRLAEILVLDQFSRNLLRDSGEAFATDALALALAQEAVAAGVDARLPVEQQRFVYMPYMHSESLVIHDEAVRLFDQPGLEDNLRFEHLHRDIIVRFGRYPHRNALLGRVSTPGEEAFLQQPGSSF
ncbi:MAG: DUF924 family protein [bacterium]|jgi:uncharacterized protein (DUF924 family)|nr:DUF924 domain-containing protein [Betaproteobacteria bacterium]